MARFSYPPGAGGGGGTPGGSDTQVQFNDGGAFGGDAGMTYVKGTGTLALGNLVLTTALPVAQGGTGATSASNARTNLGLVIGTDVQAQNDILQDLAGLTQAANKGLYFDSSTTAATFDLTAGGRALVNSAGTADTFPYFSASNTVTLGSITAAGLALLDDAAASNQRTTLGLGSDDSPTFTGLTLSASSALSFTNADATILGEDAINLKPDNDRQHGFARFVLGNNPAEPGGGSELHQTFAILYGQTDSVSNYFNPDLLFAARDSSGNAASAYSWGSEGNWTNAGGFTEERSYWYEYGANRTLLMHQLSTPDYLNVGEDAADKGLRLNIYGQTLTTDTDGEIGALYATARYTKNDTNTRAFSHVQLKPTLNFGGSNTNTTVHVFDLDTTNTATTGATVNLLNVKYGGSARLTLSSGGTLALTGSQTISGSVQAASASFTTSSGANVLNVGSPTQTTGSVNLFSTDAAPTLTLQRVSANANGPGQSQFKARGSGTGSESVALSGDTILNLVGAGYDAASSGQAWPTSAFVQIRGVLLENASTTAHGARLDFRTATTGTTTTVTRAIADNTGLTIGATTAARGTTEPTNALNIFDGTAPVGTLTNGCSFYSTSGEMRVMDAAGNATLLSPHNRAGEWIHDEINFLGRWLVVDMERLVKAVDKMLGGGYVFEAQV